MVSPKKPSRDLNIREKLNPNLNVFPKVLCAFIAVMTCLTVGSSLLAKENYMTDPRVALIRGLDREIAVAKIPLPAGKKGVVITREGEINQGSAAEQLRSNGMSVNAGMPVEITKIDFHDDKIVFEINGGGKTGKKWYQHIDIGMGPGAMQPLVQDQPQESRTLGSYVTLILPDKGKVPTTDQVKQMLSSVLDFHRQAPTVLYSSSLPPKVKEAIKKHEVMPGMDKDAVLSARGVPDRKVRDVKPDGSEEEDWIYGLPPHCLYVVFDGGTVQRVTQY